MALSAKLLPFRSSRRLDMGQTRPRWRSGSATSRGSKLPSDLMGNLHDIDVDDERERINFHDNLSPRWRDGNGARVGGEMWRPR